MKPFISCICPTYGRVARLRECIATFLNQDYDGKREMVVVNSFTKQNLLIDAPNVKIINLPTRPATLGECRNIAIQAASGDVMMTFDDDDLFLPNCLSTYAKHFEEGIDWVWLSKQFYAEKFKIKEVMAGQVNSCAFTKKAWNLVGGYSALTVGEDTSFIGKVTAQTKGVKVRITPRDIVFIYSWGNQTYKTSGFGPDKPTHIAAHLRVEKEVAELVRRGIEPVGAIKINPRLEHDPSAMKFAFLESAGLLSAEKQGVCIVELGRFGDICNILPICKHVHDNYGKPHLMVSKEFASMLEGVSYVIPHIVNLDNSQINEAMKIARAEYQFVIQTQIWGKNYEQKKLCKSYNEESWRMGGFWPQFNNPTIRPYFDLRDKERENALAAKLSVSGKPLLLVNVTKSVSSPFPSGHKLLEEITRAFAAHYEIIDVSDLKANAIYDMIGVMDRAACLVSIDTALLHFAGASTVPVVAMVNQNPWAGSEPRSNVQFRIPYDTAARHPEQVISAIGNALMKHSGPFVNYAPETAPSRRLFHCVERHDDTNPNDIARKQHAQKSWDVLYGDFNVVPCHLWNYPRDARSLGDARPLPFLKDVLKHGMDQAGDDDIIFWTNDDNWLHPQLAELLLFHCSIYDVCVSRRMEFRSNPFPPKDASPEVFAQRGEHHIGRDIFAATKSWLVKSWDIIPDIVLGEPLFDLHLAALVRLYHGYSSDRKSLFTEHIHPAELPIGYCAHQFHTPQWTRERKMTNGRKRNSDLFKEFVAKQNLPLTFTPGGDI